MKVSMAVCSHLYGYKIVKDYRPLFHICKIVKDCKGFEQHISYFTDIKSNVNVVRLLTAIKYISLQSNSISNNNHWNICNTTKVKSHHALSIKLSSIGHHNNTTGWVKFKITSF